MPRESNQVDRSPDDLLKYPLYVGCLQGRLAAGSARSFRLWSVWRL